MAKKYTEREQRAVRGEKGLDIGGKMRYNDKKVKKGRKVV